MIFNVCIIKILMQNIIMNDLFRKQIRKSPLTFFLINLTDLSLLLS